MTNLFGTGIFWTTLIALTAIFSLATIIGRAWAPVFPLKLRAIAKFYLAPVMGLASLVIIASVIGRVFTIGNSVVVPWIVIAILVFALFSERNIGKAFYHALLVSVFGIVCAVSILGPLFVHGGLNTHNDTFTYLVHGNWLQTHAFNEIIPAETVTPLTTQISLYQLGYRMGGSFLLALLQALLNLQWSYEVYPAVVSSAIGVCCLAIGFPIAQTLRHMRRSIRLAMLSLPALNFGGLVFGANLGFLPQTVGLAIGTGFIFTLGPMLRWVCNPNTKWFEIGKGSLPCAVLFAGATFAYSEIAPFLLVAGFASGMVLSLRYRTIKNVVLYGSVLFGFSILLLNTELLRACVALRAQSVAAVGTAVDWTLLGYIGHAFGVHGGAWDVFQWSLPENYCSPSFILGLLCLGLAGGVIFVGGRFVFRSTTSGDLMPTVGLVLIFMCCIMFFRYFVQSPFPKGVGQSWSQFKLSEWAHPFLLALVLLALASLRPRLGRSFNSLILALFVIALVSTTLFGIARVAPLIKYYRGVHDLNQFYFDFRNTVLSTCPRNEPIYLALGGQHHKFRQMVVLYLYDREVKSDWSDDGYIYNRLPLDQRKQELTTGSCVVEPLAQDGLLSQGTIVGPFRVGVLDGHSKIRIASVEGAYDRESDEKNWWHWVERNISFKLQVLFVPENTPKTKVSFEYGTRGEQAVLLRIIMRDGRSQEVLLQSNGNALERFEKVFDIPPMELSEIRLETNGAAYPLGNGDPRSAAWIIRNLRISSVFQ